MAAKPPYMQWYCRDWVSDLAVQSMDPVARCGYFEILNRMWMAGGVLPDDDKTLETASTLTKKMWAKHRGAIRQMLLQASPGMTAGIPGEYRSVSTQDTAVSQKRLLGEYERACKVLEAKSRGGKNNQDSSNTLPGVIKDTPEDSSKTPRSKPEAEAEADKKISEAKASSPPKATPSWGGEFAQWWSIWPRKTAKPDAKKAYEKLVVKQKSPGLPDFAERHARLMETTALWAEREFAARDIAAVPYPATYLRRMDWLEPPAETTKRMNVIGGSGRISDAERRQQESQDNIREWLERKRGGSDSDRVIEIRADLP